MSKILEAVAAIDFWINAALADDPADEMARDIGKQLAVIKAEAERMDPGRPHDCCINGACNCTCHDTPEGTIYVR